MMKSTSPRSIISMTQPPSPAGVIAPAMVSPMVVSCSGASIFSEKIAHASDKPRGVERLKSFVDEVADLLAPCRPVVPNRLA